MTAFFDGHCCSIVTDALLSPDPIISCVPIALTKSHKVLAMEIYMYFVVQDYQIPWRKGQVDYARIAQGNDPKLYQHLPDEWTST